MSRHTIYPHISKLARAAADAFIAGRPYHHGDTTVLAWKKTGEVRMIHHKHVIAQLTKDKNLWIYGPRMLRIKHYKGTTMRQNWILKGLVGSGYTIVKHGGSWFSMWDYGKEKWHLIYDSGVYINLVAAKLGVINICSPEREKLNAKKASK